MKRIRPATQLRKAVKHPHCQAITKSGYVCKFPQETNGDGYFTGACGSPQHQAQIRLRGTDA